jgi:glycosyltransferase involved in cell wall biosynthesis
LSANVSIAIITLNEADRIADCLQSVAFARDVVVVDSGSTDKTPEIAASLGARVLREPWRGFAAQKQFAVDQCQNNWVLILDADERVSAEAAVLIDQAVSQEGKTVAAYSFKRRNYLYGRWIKRSGWWPDRIVRLVRKDAGRFSQRAVHEQWVAEGAVEAWDVCIEHFSFRCCSDLVAKMERYSTLGAQDLLKEGRHANSLTPALHGAWTFFQTYFLQLGLMDGYGGFLIAVMNAGGAFLKYAKLLELLWNKKGLDGFQTY